MRLNAAYEVQIVWLSQEIHKVVSYIQVGSIYL